MHFFLQRQTTFETKFNKRETVLFYYRVGRYDGVLLGQTRPADRASEDVRARDANERDVVGGELVGARVLLILGMDEDAVVLDELVVVVASVVVAIEKEDAR